MVSLVDLFLVTALVTVLALWWQAQRTREIALAATKRALNQQQLRLLDDTVALRSAWFKRDKHGKLRFWRRYNFEFTVTGDERYQGFVVTLGNCIANIELPPHRFPDSTLH